MSKTTQWLVWIVIVIVMFGGVSLYRYIAMKSHVKKQKVAEQKILDDIEKVKNQSKAKG